MYHADTYNYQPYSSDNSWLNGNFDFFTKIMGFSFVASLFQGDGSSFGGVQGGSSGANASGGLVGGITGRGSYIWNTLSLLLLGLLVETGRRFCQWMILRITFQYSITAQFTEGDAAYEWIILFLTNAQVWRSSREFRVTAKSSQRKWSVKLDNASSASSGSTLSSLFSLASLRTFFYSLPLVGDASKIASLHLEEKNRILSEETQRPYKDPHAEYVPTYKAPQLFRWKGYWIEIQRHGNQTTYNPVMGHQSSSVIYVTIYTHDMNVLSSFVEEARQGYVKTNRPHVIVHTPDHHSHGPMFTWSNSKAKARRPLSSIILQEGVINSLVADVKEFLETEEWYVKAGIPHRRGYLLYGPPGTGKTSTIYAIAGDLGLEVYCLSLASSMMDDGFLQRAVVAVPKNSILLIEDIDCAFPAPRNAGDEAEARQTSYMRMYSPGLEMDYSGFMGRSRVTLSGLLNVLDGIGSEEGKIFFATTNHVERLDAAFLRPGRIDRKIQYRLASQAQAEALFLRFYPETVLKQELENKDLKSSSSEKRKPTQDTQTLLHSLAGQFSSTVPPHEFSTAELQGYLLSWKKSPCQAAVGIAAWVESEIAERQAKKEKKAKAAAEKEAKRLKDGYGPSVIPGMPNYGIGVGSPIPPLVYGVGIPNVNGDALRSPPIGREVSPPTNSVDDAPALPKSGPPLGPIPAVSVADSEAQRESSSQVMEDSSNTPLGPEC